jgi:hypothetical protein
MNAEQIKFEIMGTNFTNDQLNEIVDAVKYARSRLQKQIKRSLMVGDNVNFGSAKQGRNVTGIVTKIAIKYVTVKTAQGLWKVPANMLTLVQDEEFA